MPQVKKADVRDAILKSAFELFSRHGYAATTVAAIAKDSGMRVSNLYVYFPSKLVLLYAIYEPWIYERLSELRDSTMRCRSPRTRVRRLILGIWHDIPSTDHGLANAIVEALSTTPQHERKPSDLLMQVEKRVTQLLIEILPPARHALVRDGLVSHLMWMAFDGFAVNRRLGDVRDMDALADLWTDFLLGPQA